MEIIEVMFRFLPGTFDPGEVMWVVRDFVTVSQRVSTTSEPECRIRWNLDDSVKVTLLMEKTVFEGAFVRHNYRIPLQSLNAIFS